MSILGAGLATTGLVAAGATAASATGSPNNDIGEGYYASNSWDSTTGTHFSFGDTLSSVFVGDWDGDGVDTFAVREGNVISYTNTFGHVDHFEAVFEYGREGDQLVVGDWDGDGADSFGVRRGNAYHLRDEMSGGPADTIVNYGRADDTVLVGDWDGDGADSLAVRRGAEYFLHNSLESGPADEHAVYGRADDTVLVGDWDGDGADSLGVRRGITVYLHNSITTGAAETVLDYGRSDDGLIVGDWDGDGVDTPMVRRADAVEDAVLAAATAAAEGRSADLDAVTNVDGYDELWYAFQGFYDPPMTPSSIQGCGQDFNTGVIYCDVYADGHERPVGRAEVAPLGANEFEIIGYEIFADWEGTPQ
ncbi:hypothetical protein ACPYO6_07795 [Georgenia sp. Z1344]|uniref:hypothetical protein n=1 Tax=Georgenia sp. Z1344 TaxID=3416706 RepID=UPI003CE76204